MFAAQKTVIVIQGPTAVGKTAVAIELAQRLGTVIISADSRQCYREMNIGTARPSLEELMAVRHYFIAEYPVTQLLSAADFEAIALNHLERLFTQHDRVVVCGGTGLYIKALCDGLDIMPQVNEQVKTETELAYKERGLDWLQRAVRSEDSLFYHAGEIQNPARLLRALTFIRSTGTSITAYRTKTSQQRPFRIIKIGLELERDLLYQRINTRVDRMMDAGLEAEVRSLYPYRTLKNLQTVGYSELFDYMDGHCTQQEATDKIKQHSRNYAKRQITWFKKDQEIMWFRANEEGIVDRVVGMV